MKRSVLSSITRRNGRAFGLLGLAGLLDVLPSAWAADVADAQVHALFQRYCFECHGSKEQKVNLNLEATFGGALQRDHSKLETVTDVVVHREMPPDDAELQPTEAERAQLLSWLKAKHAALVQAQVGDPGRVIMPRLTKVQYDHVIRDLTGRDLKAARYFPDDVVSKNGFNHMGEELSVTASHIASYLAGARHVLSHALITPERGIRWFGEPVTVTRTPEELRQALIAEWLNWHLAEESKALNDHGGEHYKPEQAEQRSLRFADYWEAAWRVRHAGGAATAATVAAEFQPALLAPVLQRWLEILGGPAPTPLVGQLCAWWQGLPSPERLPRVEFRRQAGDWTRRLLALQRPSPDKSWFATRADLLMRLYARGPGETTHPAELNLRFLKQNLEIPEKRQEHDAAVRHNEALLDHARYPLEVDLAKFGGKELVLVATDAWDGNTGDEILWQRGKFTFADGREEALPEIRLQAPAMRKLPVPDGATRFTVDVQLSDRDKAHASAQALILNREPTGDQVRYYSHRGGEPDDPDAGDQARNIATRNEGASDPKARFHSQRFVLTWPEGRDRWLAAQRDLMQLFARSGKAGANGQPARPIYATDFLPAGAMPLQRDESRDVLPFGPYFLDQGELVALASSEARAAREALQRDLIMVAQLPLRGENLAAVIKEGAVPEDWPEPRRAKAEAFLTELTANARGQLESFVRRAWRREIDAAELDHLTGLFRRELTAGASYDAAMKRPLVFALVSPHFLYRQEIAGVGETRPLDDYERASRLSFFLWSCGPNDVLLAAAKAGHLDLKTQLARMLADGRVRALAEELFGRWLGFQGFDEWSAPDAERFPEFTPTLRHAMHEEAVLFFTQLLRENRPLTDLVASRRTFLNEELARHYGVAGVTGAAMREVTLTDTPRGGLLGFGSILTRTSAPLRTSPVFRGVWLQERVLGRHLPLPPVNVPQLSGDEKDAGGTSLTEQLAQHRANKTCAACHDKIDPPGLSLENFDPIGRWRDTYRDGAKVIIAGEIKNRPLHSVGDLRDYLAGRIDEIARTFSEKLLEFSLGRQREAGDAPLIERMFAAMQRDGWRTAPAFEELVTSPQFNRRRHQFAANP